MSASLVIRGLQELIEELQRLPSDLVLDATPIVLDAANRALDQMVYPKRSGALNEAKTLAVTDGGPFGVAVVVKNTSKLAHIFENGSQARHTALGANRGSMPPGHIFIPAMQESRRWMYAQFATLIEQHGLTVTGSVL